MLLHVYSETLLFLNKLLYVAYFKHTYNLMLYVFD